MGDSEACAVRRYLSQVTLPGDVVDVECKVSTRVEYWGRQGHLGEALRRHPRPDAVVVFLGTNHYGQLTTPDVGPVLEEIRGAHASCVWAGPTSVHGRRWPVDGLIKDAVSPTCVYYDTEAADIPLADGVHPTGEGALRWLRDVWPLVGAEEGAGR